VLSPAVITIPPTFFQEVSLNAQTGQSCQHLGFMFPRNYSFVWYIMMLYQLQWLFFIGLLTAKDEGTTALQNVGKCSSINTTS